MLQALFPKFYWKNHLLKNGLKPIRTRSNHLMILQYYNISSMDLFKYKYRNQNIYYTLKAYSFFCNSFIDVGAHIGYFTITIGEEMSKKGPVISIEPDPINFLFLKKNVKINNINVHLENVAVSKEEGVAEFFLHKVSTACNTLIKNDPIGYRGSIKVKTTTINNIIEKYNPPEPILVKVDIEGYEIEMIKAWDKLIKKNCVIISEFTPSCYRKLNRDPKDYLEEIFRFGYEIYDMNTEKHITCNEIENICDCDERTDLIFLKRKNLINIIK